MTVENCQSISARTLVHQGTCERRVGLGVLRLMAAGLVIVMSNFLAFGYITTGGTISADKWATAWTGLGDCPRTSLVDGILNVEKKLDANNNVLICIPHTQPTGVNSYLHIELLRPSVVESVLVVNFDIFEGRMVGTDLWVGMTSSTLVACNANPQGSGLYSCGSKIGKHLRLQQTRQEYVHAGEIRAYSVPLTTKSQFTLTHSAYNCTTGTQDLFSWPLSGTTPLKKIIWCSACRQILAPAAPAFYQVTFNQPRYVHVILLIGSDQNYYLDTQNWKLFVLVNNVYTKYGEWVNTDDNYGKEVPVGLTTTSFRIERNDGVGLRLFMVGIFSTLTDCSGAFDWSASQQTWPLVLSTASVEKQIILRATLGDCPLAHFLDLTATYPSYIAYYKYTQILTVTPPASLNQVLQVKVVVNSVNGATATSESIVATINICTLSLTASPSSLDKSLEITGLTLQVPLSFTVTPATATMPTYTLAATAPSYFQITNSILNIDASAPAGTYTFNIIATDTACSVTIPASIRLYDCSPTGFAFASSSVKIDFFESAKSVTWSADAKDPLCGSYDINPNSLSPMLTIGTNSVLVKATSFAQMGTQTLTVNLMRLAKVTQTTSTTIDVVIYCVINPIVPQNQLAHLFATPDFPYQLDLATLFVNSQGSSYASQAQATLKFSMTCSDPSEASDPIKAHDNGCCQLLFSLQGSMLSKNKQVYYLVTCLSVNPGLFCDGLYTISIEATHQAQTEKGLNSVSISVKYDCLYLANQGVYSVPVDAKLIYWPDGTAASRIDQTALQFKTGDPAFDVSHYLVARVNYAYSCQVQYDFTCLAGQASCIHFTDLFQSGVQNTDMRAAYSLSTQLRVKQTTSTALEFNGANLQVDAYVFSTDVLQYTANTTPQYTGQTGFVSKISWTHPISLSNTAPTITSFVSDFKVSPGQKAQLLVGQLSDKESPKSITIASITAQCVGQGKWIILPTTGSAISQLAIDVDVQICQANDTCVVSFEATDNDPVSPLSVTGQVTVEVLSLPTSAQTLTTTPSSLNQSLEITGLQLSVPLSFTVTPATATNVIYSLGTNAPSYFHITSNTLQVDASAPVGTYAFSIAATDSACSGNVPAQIRLYDCSPTGFAFASSSVKIDFFESAKSVTWSADAKDPLCGSYDINPTSLSPMLTISTNSVLVKATSLAQMGTQTLTVTLMRLAKVAQTTSTTIDVVVYCVINPIVPQKQLAHLFATPDSPFQLDLATLFANSQGASYVSQAQATLKFSMTCSDPSEASDPIKAHDNGCCQLLFSLQGSMLSKKKQVYYLVTCLSVNPGLFCDGLYMILVVATHPTQTEKGLNTVSISVKYDCLYLANQGVYSVPVDAKLIYWPDGTAASRIDQTALQFKIGDPAFDVSHQLVARVNYAYSCQVQYDFSCPAGQASCKYFADVFQSGVQNTDMKAAYNLSTQLRVKQTASIALEFNNGNLQVDAYVFSTDVLPNTITTTPQYSGKTGFASKISWTHPITIIKDLPIVSKPSNTAPTITSFVSEFKVSPAQKMKLLVGELSDKESPKNITLATVTAQCSGQDKWIILPATGQIISQLAIGVDVPTGQANDTCVVSFNATDNDPISPLSVTGKVKVEVLSPPSSTQTTQSNSKAITEDLPQIADQQLEPKQEEQKQKVTELLSRWFPQPTPAQTAKFRDVPLILDAKYVSSAGILSLEFNRPVALNEAYLSQQLDQLGSHRVRRRLGTQADQELVYKMISEAFDVQYKPREDSVQTGLLNYKVTDFRKAKEIDIQLNFNEPLYVSFAAEGNNRLTMDQLIVSLKDPKVFIDPNLDKPITPTLLQKEAISVPRLAPVSKPVASQVAQATTQAMVKVLVPSTLVMNVLIGVSLKKLWSTVNLLQFLTYVNLWRLSMPANLENFFDKASFFARGDWIPKQQILGKMHLAGKTSDDKQGLQNRFLILILAVIAVVTLLAVLMVYVCRRYSAKIVQFCQRMKQKIFWNAVIRYSLQTCLDFAITLMVALTHPQPIGKLKLYKVLVFLLALKPVGYFILLHSRFDSLDQPESVSSIGTLYQGIKVTSFPAVCYNVLFLARRIIFAVITVYAGRLDGGLTVGLVVIQLILFSCYLAAVSPQDQTGNNLIELSSEILLTYCFFGVMACLATSEPKQQYFVAWLSVAAVAILVLVCVAYLAGDSVMRLVRWAKQKLATRKRLAEVERHNREQAEQVMKVQATMLDNAIIQVASQRTLLNGANNMTLRQDESLDDLQPQHDVLVREDSEKLVPIGEESLNYGESDQRHDDSYSLSAPRNIELDSKSVIEPECMVPVKTRLDIGPIQTGKLTLDELMEPWKMMQHSPVCKKSRQIQPHEELKFSIDDLQVDDSTTKSIKRHYSQIKARLDEDFEKFKQQRLQRFKANPIQSP